MGTKVKFTRLSYGGKPYSIHITSEDEGARDMFEAAWNGGKWLRFNQGKLETVDYYETPPKIVDEDMKPYWPVARAPRQEELLFKGGVGCMPGIIVKHLHGYSGKYEEKAALLIECGFECMRSQKSESSQYWEHWYLPGTWCAKGPINGMKVDAIVKWLFRNVSPGNVVIEGDNWGLSITD
jgi:hypothetical protein